MASLGRPIFPGRHSVGHGCSLAGVGRSLQAECPRGGRVAVRRSRPSPAAAARPPSEPRPSRPPRGASPARARRPRPRLSPAGAVGSPSPQRRPGSALGSLIGRPGASSGPPPGSGPPGCGPLLRPSLPALSAGCLPRRGGGSGPSVGRAAALGAVGLGALGSLIGRPWAPRPAPPLPRALRLLPPLRLASSAPAPSRRGLRPPPRRGFAARGPGPPRGRLGQPPGACSRPLAARKLTDATCSES